MILRFFADARATQLQEASGSESEGEGGSGAGAGAGGVREALAERNEALRGRREVLAGVLEVLQVSRSVQCSILQYTNVQYNTVA